jgi:autotransporter translocation and assembly factor TamB
VVSSVDTSGAVAGSATLAGARFVRGRDDEEDDRIVAGGRAHWAGNLSMGIDQWEADLELDSLSAVLSGYDLHSNGPVHIHHAGAATTIDSSRWHTPLGDLLLRGTVGDELNLSAVIDSLTPAMVVDELAGIGSARIDLTGSLQQPQAVARISLGDLTMGGHSVGDFEAQLALRQPQALDSLVVIAALDQSLLGLAEQAVSPADHASEGRSLSVRFSAAADAMLGDREAADPSRALLRIEAVDLNASGPLSYAAGDSLSALLSVRGELSLLASRLGDWGHAEGTLEIERLDLGNAAARVGLQARETTVVHVAAGKRIEMPAAALLPVQRFDDEQERFEDAGMLSMRTASEADRARVSIELEEVDLRVIEALSAGSIELPGGAIDGSLAIDDSTQGTALTLETIVYFDDFGELVIESIGNETDLHVQAAWVTPVLDSLIVTLDAPWQMQEGVVDWDAGQVRARSDGINLFLLLDLIPQLQNLDGLARVDLEINGLAGRSQVRGDIEIEDLELSLPDVAPGYVFPHGSVRFNGSSGRGEITEFIGGTDRGRGRLELSGFIDLTALDDPDYELVVDADGVPYRYEDTIDVPGLNFHVGFRRNAEERLLWGEITVDGAAIEPTLVNFSATTVPPPPALKNPFLESTALDLYLDLRHTKVKNELSDMMLEGSSRLYGTFYKPRFQGEIHLLAGGKISVLSREFTLTRGRIGLDRLVPTYSILDLAYDPLLLNPELDIEAVADVWNHDDQEAAAVVMTLSGTALQTQPVFSSPGLGDTEVLSLLAFGSTKSFRTDDLYTAAGQLLLRGQVSKVGLDEFALLPSGTVSESIGKTTVRVGKFFSFLVPIWVRYETPTSFPTNGEVELEYKLGSFLNIKASSQSEYDLYGAGIGVKKSY